MEEQIATNGVSTIFGADAGGSRQSPRGHDSECELLYSGGYGDFQLTVIDSAVNAVPVLAEAQR